MTMLYSYIVRVISKETGGSKSKKHSFIFLIEIPYLMHQFCKKVHCWWQCDIEVLSGLYLIMAGSKDNSFLIIFVEIKYLINGYCLNSAYKLIVDQCTFKYFQSRTSGVRSKGEILFYISDWNCIFNELFLFKFYIQVHRWWQCIRV